MLLIRLWGKFGQRSNFGKSEVIRDPSRWFQLQADPAIEVKDVEFIGEEAMLVSYGPASEEVEEMMPYTNMFIAAFTTCWARLELYGYMDKLGSRTLYTDTGEHTTHIFVNCFLLFQTASFTLRALAMSTMYLPAATWEI